MSAARRQSGWRSLWLVALAGAVTAMVPMHALAAADLSIAIVRSGLFEVNSTVSYVATVTNHGPGAQAGRISVTGTFPAGLTITSTGGTGWACTSTGCFYDAGLARNRQAPALTIKATVTSPGEKTVTATVTSANDNNASNDTAVDTATAYGAGQTPDPPGDVKNYALTDRECAVGAAIGSRACDYYSAATTGGRAATLYITALDDAARVKAPSTSTVRLQFALRCVNPAASAGVAARLGGFELKQCAPGSEAVPAAVRWSALDVAFGPGKASTAVSFEYADVGSVALHLMQGTAPGTHVEFVSKPVQVGIRQVYRGSVAVPPAIGPDGTAFAVAGEPLLVQFGALVEGAAGTLEWAKNFGNEAVRPRVTLGNDATALYSNISKDDYLQRQPAPLVNEATWKQGSGIVSVEASWGEAGATRFVAGLADYLGAGAVAGGSKDVGRFYPAYFSTDITEAYPCGSGIACPQHTVDPLDTTNPTASVGVVYSGQPFEARVVARNVQGRALSNYTGAWFRSVTLSAVGPKGAVAAGTLAPAVLTTGLSATLVHTLPSPYSVATHRTGNWQAPVAFFLRAEAADGLDAKGVSSDRSPAMSHEDGVVVLSGRLQVGSALGTDVLRTALALRAQFWSGAAWVTHAEYKDLDGVAATFARFEACTHTLAGTGSPCDTALVGVSSPQDAGNKVPENVVIQRGSGVLWLRAPGKRTDSPALQGRSRKGSISVRFRGWTWLPSTVGRVNFGSYASRFIYQRELY